MSFALTQRQAQALDFIRTYLADHDGVGPTVEEVAAHLNMKSKGGASLIIRHLVMRGHLRRFGIRPRALQVVDTAAPANAATQFLLWVARLPEPATGEEARMALTTLIARARDIGATV